MHHTVVVVVAWLLQLQTNCPTCPAKPLPHVDSLYFSSNIFVTFAVVSFTFTAHFNAPDLYMEMKNRSLKKFIVATVCGFGIACFFDGLLGVCGYLLFGSDVSQNLLDSVDKDILGNSLRCLSPPSLEHTHNLGTCAP